jgi:hypothetical protein
MFGDIEGWKIVCCLKLGGVGSLFLCAEWGWLEMAELGGIILCHFGANKGRKFLPLILV